jgi:hypothetical protein
LLFYTLLKNNIDGKFYKCIKALYDNPTASVKLGPNFTEWFEICSGVRQGDVLSPSLFGLFINDLADTICNLNLGIDIGLTKISILLYADDIVIIAESENELQTILDTVHEWCSNWRLKINRDKSNVIHFINTRCKKQKKYLE